jgi:hypothetical protein
MMAASGSDALPKELVRTLESVDKKIRKSLRNQVNQSDPGGGPNL